MKLLELIAHAAAAELTTEQLAQLNAELTGMERAIGMRYTRVDSEGVAAELAVTEQHLQPVGLVNGGVYTALAESVGSLAGLVVAGGRPVVGVNNNTDFYRAVSDGTLTSTAIPVHRGRSQQVWAVETVTEDGKVAARGQVRLQNLDG